MRLASTLILALLAGSACAQDQAQSGVRKPGWWLRAAHKDGKSIAISADGSIVQEAGSVLGHVPSPDGKLYVRIGAGRSGRGRDLILGGENRKELHLTSSDSREAWPTWSSDGKAVVFSENVGGRWQPRRVVIGGAFAIETLGETKGNVVHLSAAADGRVAWIERQIPKRFTKLPNGDLVVRSKDGKKRVKLIEDASLLGCAFSPDGKLLLVSRPNAIGLWNVDTRKKVRTWDLIALGKRVGGEMWSHGAWRFAWRPDGKAFACRITFLGGREGDTRIFGDDEVFLMPLKGPERAVNLRRFGAPAILWWEPKTR